MKFSSVQMLLKTLSACLVVAEKKELLSKGRLVGI